MYIRWLKAAGIAVLVTMLVVAAGCSKQRARYNISRARKLLLSADKFEGARHAKTAYETAQNQMRQAEQTLPSDPTNANTIAGTAVASARAAYEEARQKEATQEKLDADHEVQIMKDNNARTEGGDVYDEVLTKLQPKMEEQFSRQKWERTIETAKDIKGKVERLLERLRTEANKDLIAVEFQYKKLVDEQGQEHALIYVQRVDDLIKMIKENINPPVKNYVNASALAKQAIKDAFDGITEAKRKRGDIKIEEIQSGLITAQQKKAEFFVPELWAANTEDFAKLVDNFWKKEYDFVLDASGRLSSQVATMIHETRKASAEFERDKLNERIADLTRKGVQTYLPGRIEPIDQAFQEAKKLLEEEADVESKAETKRYADYEVYFNKVEDIAKNARVQADSIRDDFKSLSQKYIAEARKLVGVAQGLYQDMDRIFREVHPQYTKPVDQAVEDQKLATKAQLRERVTHAQAGVDSAEGRLQVEEYRDAIEMSRRVQDEATSIVAAIYNVVAVNVITEISDQISRYEREGAPELAQTEMATAKKALDESAALRDKGEFQESARQAAIARAELERAVQAIEEGSVKVIEHAAKAIADSNAYRTSELKAQDYGRAEQLVNQSRKLLENSQLRDARLMAQHAEQLILEASRDSATAWAQDQMRAAQDRLAQAQATGADLHSAQLYNEASEDYTQAREAFAAGESLRGQQRYAESRDKYNQARILAGQAADQGNRAQFRLIEDAQNEIVEARAYDAPRTNLSELTQAILLLDQSRQAMDGKRFEESHRLARNAQALAARLTRSSKRDVFQRRLDAAQALVDEASRNGGRYYQPTVLAGLTRELDGLRQQYSDTTFDSNSQSLARVETRLQGLLDASPNVVADLIEAHRQRIAEVEKGKVPPADVPRVEDARRYLRYAEIDYKHGNYRTSYVNLLNSRRLVGGLEGDQAMKEYKDTVQTALTDLQNAMKDFDQMLSLRPNVVVGMMKGAWGDRQGIAVAGRSGAQTYRERIDEVYRRIQTVQPPASMTAYHRRLKQLFRTASESAFTYEKITALGEFDKDQRRGIIETAYDQTQQVRRMIADLEKELVPPKALAAR
jgi:hypothetical protein